MKIESNQSFYTTKVNSKDKKYNQNTGLKFKNNISKDTVSFSGVRTIVGSDGHLIDKFYLPKNLKTSDLKLCMQKVARTLGLGKYKNARVYDVDKEVKEYDIKSQDGKNPQLEIPTSRAERGYFFKIDGKKVLDPGRMCNAFNDKLLGINTTDAKVINVLGDFGEVTVNKAGNMVLIFPDSLTNKHDKKRNCVNQLGGKLENITKMVEEFQNAGYRRLVLTPTTSDPLSSHKYWAVNLYQTDKGLGTEKDYDEMISIANRNGINIVSDAAFGKTGIASYQFQDVLMRGKNSPYWNYYSINDLDNGLIDIGVLTEDTSNIGFKFINSPNRSDYDAKKDTYVQIFDKRLVTDEEATSNEIIMGYQNDNVPKDKQNDFIGSNRAVVPYYFPVNPNEIKGNKEKKFDINSLEFENYRISKSKYVGFDQWDGMQDLVKEKFYMDNMDNLNFNLTQGEYEKRQKGCWKVQDAEVLAGVYSTKRVANVINEDTAIILHDMGVMGKDASQILDMIKGESSAIKNMVKTAPNRIDKESIENSLNDKYLIKNVDFFSNADDYLTKELMSVPFETLDVSQSLLATLSSSAISKRASVENEVGKTRYEVMKGYNDGDYDVKPYENVQKEDLKSYKATDEMFTQILVPMAKDVLKSIETNDKKIFDGDKLTDVGRYAIKFMASDIFKFFMYKALNNDIKPEVDKKTGRLYYNLSFEQREGLSLRRLNSFNRTNPENDALNVVNSLKKGLGNVTDADKKELADILKKRFEKYDKTSLKLASMLIDKAETGLDWRLDAAKDVSSINLLRAHQETYDNVMDNVTRFWKKFDNAIYKQNPHAYVVGEFTAMEEFHPGYYKDNRYYADTNLKYPTDIIAESQIREDSNMTSAANFNFTYGLVGCFGLDSETGEANKEGKGEDPLGFLMSRFMPANWASCSGFSTSDDIRRINQSYTFAENHDKPRILSVFALDMQLLFSQFDNEEHKQMAAKVVNGGDFKNTNYSSIDFTKLSAKSIAMGYRLNQAIDATKDKLGLSDSEIKDLRDTIGKLSSSDVKQSNEAFGVKPINDAIGDVIEQSQAMKSKTVAEKAQVADKILEEIIKPAASKYVRLYKMLSTLPGCTTDYLGTSMGLSGWEATSKNPYQQCRAAIPEKDKLPQWLKDCLLEPVAEIQNMKNSEKLSPLVDGDTYVLPFTQKDSVDKNINVAKRVGDGMDVRLASLLRYNQEGDVIINVYNFDGIDNKNNTDVVQNTDLELEELVVYDPNGSQDARLSPFRFKDGAKFKIQGDDTNEEYIIQNKSDGQCVIKKQGGGNIKLSQKDMNTTVFYMV